MALSSSAEFGCTDTKSITRSVKPTYAGICIELSSLPAGNALAKVMYPSFCLREASFKNLDLFLVQAIPNASFGNPGLCQATADVLN